jgi:hypothetical protein
MAKIKRYTDISQARILDEILLSKGADMFFKCFGEETYDLTFCEVSYSEWAKDFKKLYDKAGIKVIPCWSLSALFSVIPQEIFDGEYIINITEGRDNKWILTYDHYENRNHSYYGLSAGADNLVDACYEIIIKLHERKML